jgi:hypothetical protein
MLRTFVMLLMCLILSDPVVAQTPSPTPPTAHPTGRFQLVVVTGHAGSPFLVDTTSGCVWHMIQDEKTKRSTFIEMDVENLHWSWGSGAQQLLASRVDSSNLNDEQKRSLKQDLQKTGCGLASVVLTPGRAQVKAPESPELVTPPGAKKPKK